MLKKQNLRPKLRTHVMRLFWSINLLLFALAIWLGTFIFNTFR
jgi:hypothetical protein